MAKAVDALRSTHRLLDPKAEWLEIPFDGAAMTAILRRPTGAERPPLVVLIPGLDSTKEEFFGAETIFHDRGMATLTLEGPGQGDTGRHLNIRPDFDVPFAAALDYIADRDDLDLDRVGAIGFSLDRLVPWRESKRTADEAPNSTWKLYGGGNHVVNNMSYESKAFAADWLREQLSRS
jgi:hypothetical protein